MRLATWNINGLRARAELVKIWLAERQPDVVGFQELKTPTADFPHDLFAELGYHALVHGEKAWNGVAILSREPAELVQTGLPGEDELGSRLLTARIGGIEFTTVYCPNGKTLDHADFARKLRWFDNLKTHWLARERHDAVLCGDFNIVPEPLDSWRGRRRRQHLPHTRRARPLRRTHKLRASRPVSPPCAGRTGVFLVGLPGRCIPSPARTAHRPDSRYAGYCQSRTGHLHRPGLP